MKQTIKISFKFILLMTLLLGVIYPVTMTGVGQVKSVFWVCSRRWKDLCHARRST